MPTYSTYHSY